MQLSRSNTASSRRWFLKAGATMLAVAALPLRVWAAMTRPDAAFTATAFDDAIAQLDAGAATDTDQITLEIPTIAEDGSRVPVTLRSHLEGTTRMMIMVEKNPNPLSAIFMIPDGTVAYAETMVKVAQTGMIYGVAEAGGKLYKTASEIKVTLGGCGG